MKHFFYFFLLAILLVSCKAKKLRKQAFEFEKHGAFEQASQYYYKSLQIDNDNVDAIVGYKKNTQILLDQTYQKFYTAFQNGDYKSSIYSYKDAKKLEEKAKRLDISLQRLNDYSVYYDEALLKYMEQQYSIGKKHLTLNNFNAAKTIFEEIVYFNELFRDAKSQLEIATYEPIYLNGIQSLEINSNRKAYYEFSQILKNSNYKDVLELKNEALEKATIKIAVSPRYSSKTTSKQKKEFKKFFISRLNDIPSPFYKMVEVPSIKPSHPLETQLNIAKSKGIKALFFININDVSYYSSPLAKSSYKAYKKISTSYKDKDGKKKTKTEYKKDECTLYSRSKKVGINLEYKLISTQDKSILVNKVLKDELRDKVKYTSYKGDYKQLVAGYWKYQTKKDLSDRVRDTNSQNRQLQSLFQARKTLVSSTKLYNNLLNTMSSNLIQSIADYDPK